MGLDKLVDSAQLNADLSAVADAIREKGGTSASLSFPSGMAQAIEDLPSGGATEPYIEETYSYYNNLERVRIHGVMPVIRSYMFYGCQMMKIDPLQSGVKQIRSHAFSDCFELDWTELPDSIEGIYDSAFSNCRKLSLTSLPSSLDSIGNWAFDTCLGLTTLTFKTKPSSIANNAFSYCNNLTTINVPWAEGAVAGAPWGATNATINYNYTGA